MGSKAHILVFPCPTQGHINGLMNFATFLSNAHPLLEVTFIHSARNYARLKRSSSSFHHPGINVVALPDGLSTADDEMEKQLSVEDYIGSIKKMVDDELGQLLSKLKEGGNPATCLVSDTLLPGTQAVADKFAIPRVDFWTSSAACFIICLHLPQLISNGCLPLPAIADIEKHLEQTIVNFIPGIPPFPLVETTKQIQATDLSQPWIQYMLESFSQVKRANRIFVHTFYEIECSVFDAAHKELGLPMYPVGPLFSFDAGMDETNMAPIASLLPEDRKCLFWLDRQSPASVIYVSFGSCATLSTEEIKELALGLQASEQPFILVLRPGSYVGTFSDILPGYTSEMKDRGLVTSWVPQRAVLAHQAVGGFLTHCGWNSTMESLWMGVPLLGCPRGSEQRANVRYIAKDWNVGITLDRQKGGGFIRQAVERAVRRLMQEQEGREARKRASELMDRARKAVVHGGMSKGYLDQFVKDMVERDSALCQGAGFNQSC